MLSDGTFTQRVNHAGVPYEYRSHFDASMHEAVGGGGAAIYRWLRYEAPTFAPCGVPVAPEENWISLLLAERMQSANQALQEAIANYHLE